VDVAIPHPMINFTDFKIAKVDYVLNSSLEFQPSGNAGQFVKSATLGQRFIASSNTRIW
jgi:hypothetical protein